MNKNSLVLPLILGALIVAAPTFAFAEDGGDSASVSGSVTTSGNPGEGRGPQGGPLGRFIKGVEDRGGMFRNASTNMPMLRDREHMGSSTRPDGFEKPERPEHMGSSTMSDRGERDGSSTRVQMGDRPQGMGKGMNIEKLQQVGGEKIDERIKNLTEQIARIGKMERLSSDQKTQITAELQAQVTALTDLKAKIGTEASSSALKDLTQSITKSYRTYAVTMPKAAITAAADRIMTVAAQMDTFSTKLSTRIDAAATAGTDVAAARTALTDYTTKIADAKVQAQAAATAVAGLSADNGDTVTQASNATTLKAAKAQIDAAQADLKIARKDIEIILKAVMGTATEN